MLWFLVSPDESQKKQRTEEKPTAAATLGGEKKIPDVQETSRRSCSVAGPSSHEIPSSEPIVPPYNGSVKLPFAQLVYVDKPIGEPEGLAKEGESDDDLVDRLRAASPCEYNHDEDLEDDPLLTLGNLKKFQANIREFSKFSVVSIKSSTFFLYIWGTGS